LPRDSPVACDLRGCAAPRVFVFPCRIQLQPALSRRRWAVVRRIVASTLLERLQKRTRRRRQWDRARSDELVPITLARGLVPAPRFRGIIKTTFLRRPSSPAVEQRSALLQRFAL